MEAEVSKASKPLANRLMVVGVVVVCAALALWMGYQFGSNMGWRTISNEAVKQAVEIRDHISKNVVDAAGRELKSHRDANLQFSTDRDAYIDANFTEFEGLKQMLASGQLPVQFTQEEWNKWKESKLIQLKKLCEDYLANVEEYSLSALFNGNIYASELALKVLDFSEKANRLRSRIDSLFVMIQILENRNILVPPPADLTPETLVLAQKGEGEKDKVSNVLVVTKEGNPEVDKEILNKDVCEPVSMELEIPTGANGPDGQPVFEKKLIDTFDKKQVQEVKAFRKIKVKTADKKDIVARFDNLFIMDLRPHLMPLIESLQSNRKSEAENMAFQFEAFLQTLMAVHLTASEVDFKSLGEPCSEAATRPPNFRLSALP